MKIKFKKLHPDAVDPYKSNPNDAGFDLHAVSVESVDNEDYGYIEYDTGLAFEIPKGYVGLCFPRSSISKTGQFLANSVGVIDSDYRGSVKVRFKTIPNTNHYKIGDRVIQMIIMPYPEIEFEESDTLSNTDRGEGGFGSTGQ